MQISFEIVRLRKILCCFLKQNFYLFLNTCFVLFVIYIGVYPEYLTPFYYFCVTNICILIIVFTHSFTSCLCVSHRIIPCSITSYYPEIVAARNPNGSCSYNNLMQPAYSAVPDGSFPGIYGTVAPRQFYSAVP